MDVGLTQQSDPVARLDPLAVVEPVVERLVRARSPAGIPARRSINNDKSLASTPRRPLNSQTPREPGIVQITTRTTTVRSRTTTAKPKPTTKPTKTAILAEVIPIPAIRKPTVKRSLVARLP